jgi:hypothetical protein
VGAEGGAAPRQVLEPVLGGAPTAPAEEATPGLFDPIDLSPRAGGPPVVRTARAPHPSRPRKQCAQRGEVQIAIHRVERQRSE